MRYTLIVALILSINCITCRDQNPLTKPPSIDQFNRQIFLSISVRDARNDPVPEAEIHVSADIGGDRRPLLSDALTDESGVYDGVLKDSIEINSIFVWAQKGNNRSNTIWIKLDHYRETALINIDFRF